MTEKSHYERADYLTDPVTQSDVAAANAVALGLLAVVDELHAMRQQRERFAANVLDVLRDASHGNRRGAHDETDGV